MMMPTAEPVINAFKNAIGSDGVLTGKSMQRWAADWTGKFRSKPLVVVRPGSTNEVSAILKLACQHKIPVVPVSGNTGLNGGTQADDAIVLSLDRMDRIRSIDKAGRVAVVEAGVILSRLRDALSGDGLTFPLSFGAEGSAMIGGCLATNAGGSNVLKYGNARDLCLGLEVVMADGAIMDILSKLHKDNSGYNLKHLMIGSEGTLGVITAAALRLFPKPRAYATAMVATTDLKAALLLLNELQDATNGSVEAFEYMPRTYIDAHLRLFPDAREPFDGRHDVNILVEIGASATRDAIPGDDGALPVVKHLIETLEHFLEKSLVLDAVIAANGIQRREMWARREVAIELARAHPVVLPNDIALPLDAIPEFLDSTFVKLKKLDPSVSVQLVSHLGDGNIHYAVHPSSKHAELHAQITETIEKNVASFGGSFSAEHGIGLTRKGAMKRWKNPVAIRSMRMIKQVLDPDGILNPGKVIPD